MESPGKVTLVSAPRVPEPQHGTLLTVTEVATFLAVKEATIRSWCAKSLMPHGKLGRDIRFDRDQLQSWLESQWSAGASAEPASGSDVDGSN